MIAPALAPATSSHFVIGFVGCSANPQSAPASARPLTPPPRKTPSASVIHSIAGSSRSRGPPGVHPCDRRARLGPLVGCVRRCYHAAVVIATKALRFYPAGRPLI